MHKLLTRTIATAAVMSITACPAQDEAPSLEAIRKATRDYVAAFNRGDASALANSWSPTGTWSDPVSGESVSGRENLKAGFEEFFKAHEGARLQIRDQTVRLLSATVAMEEGTADVTHPGSPATLSGYTAIHVLHKGAWLLDRVIETDAPVSGPEAGPLSKVAWLEGSWVDEAGGSSVLYQNDWLAGGRFMRRSFQVTVEGRINMTGREIVGWDAERNTIRSWVFDSTGGFAELTWKQSADHADRWIKDAKGVLGSGEVVSATHIMTRVDDDRYTFEAVAREKDGSLLPNIDEVTVVRSSATP